MIPPEEQLKLANQAITHVLRQIRDRDSVRYLLGAGTESLSLLCRAYAAMNNDRADLVEEHVLGLAKKTGV